MPNLTLRSTIGALLELELYPFQGLICKIEVVTALEHHDIFVSQFATTK